MPYDHAPTLRGRSDEPPGPASTGAPASAAASEVVRGTLTLADNVKAKVPTGGTIFLIARSLLPTGGVGPVLAAKRLTVGVWPQAFELSGNDVMLTGMSLKGKVVLGARVDQDGDAMTKQIGDVEGVSKPVDVPATGVVVLLDRVRTEAGGQPSPPNLGGGMPAGHPAMPPGHPTVDPSAAPATGGELPPGHPPLPAGELPAGHPPVGADKPAGHP